MKNKILTSLLLLAAVGLTGMLYAYSEEDARKDWVDTATCQSRCEKVDDCINRKSDSGPNGRTACSENCTEICETIGVEKGEF